MFSLMQKNVNIAKLRDVSLRITKVKYFHLKGDALLLVHLLCCCCVTHLCRIASHSLAPLQLTLLLKEHKNFSSWQPASGEMTEIRMKHLCPIFIRILWNARWIYSVGFFFASTHSKQEKSFNIPSKPTNGSLSFSRTSDQIRIAVS